MYVLVRHGHAGDKHRWDGEDAVRPLSHQGHRQAAGLVASLAATGASRLLSSPYLRCTQTLAPLAAATGLALATSDLLRPDADAHDLERLLAEEDMAGTVYCTHGETLTALFAHWRAGDARTGGRAGRRTRTEWTGRTGRAGTAKGAAWLVDTDGDNHRSMTYLPPRRRPDGVVNEQRAGSASEVRPRVRPGAGPGR